MYDSAPPAARDGFSFAAFMNALWVRRWLVALVSLPIGLAAAAITWFAFPADYTARTVLKCKLNKPSYLELTPTRDSSNKEETAQAQRNMLAVVRSSKILDAAIKNLKDGNLKDSDGNPLVDSPLVKSQPDSWLATNLRAGFNDDTEFMSLSLSGLHPKDQAAILNAVAIEFQKEVIREANSQRLILAERLRLAIDKTVDKFHKKREEYAGPVHSRDASDTKLQLHIATSAALTADLNKLEAELRRTEKLRDQAKVDLIQAKADLFLSIRYGIGAPVAAVGGVCVAESQHQPRPVSPIALEAALARSPAILRQTKFLTDAEQELADRTNKVKPENDTLLPGLREKVETAKIELLKIQKTETETITRMLRTQAVSVVAEQLAQLERNVTLLMDQWKTQKDAHGAALAQAQPVPLSSKQELDRTEVEQLEEMYKTLKDKREKLNFELANADADMVVVASLASDKLAADTRGQIIRTAGAGVGATALVILGLGFWEMSRRRLRTREEVTARVGLRVLGTLPQIRNPVSRVALGPPGKTLFGDHADSIRTLLLSGETLVSPEGVPVRSLSRVIVVTSASPAEGKSILALNLVASLVRAGKRTLLIDADLRRPSLHSSLGCDDNPGLSEVLTGAIPVGDAIQCPTPGFGFIAAGLMCDEGLEALGRVDHTAFIGELLKEWDVIVLDTPPILSAPDGLILGGVADGVLLAVRSGVSHTEEVCEASRLLEDAGCRVLGAVLNGVSTNRSVYNYRARRSQSALVKPGLSGERPLPGDSRSKVKRAGGVP